MSIICYMQMQRNTPQQPSRGVSSTTAAATATAAAAAERHGHEALPAPQLAHDARPALGGLGVELHVQRVVEHSPAVHLLTTPHHTPPHTTTHHTTQHTTHALVMLTLTLAHPLTPTNTH